MSCVFFKCFIEPINNHEYMVIVLTFMLCLIRLNSSPYTGEMPHQCKECKKTFVRQDHLKTRAETHIKDGENMCPLCNKTLGTKDSLRKHISYVHSKTSSMCSRCGKSGMNKNQLRNHIYQAKQKGKCPKEKSNIKIEL